MKRILMAGILAALALVALPDRSHAWGRNPYNSHGYGWLGSLAFRTKPGIFYDGPLFNYGPYNTQGLVWMHIPQPYHGSYTPADPTLWNRGYAPYAPVPGYPYGTPAGAPPR